VLRGDPKRHAGPDHAGQKLRLAEALRAHTETPHRAAGWPFRLGRLAAGWGADLVALSGDPRALPPAEWTRLRVRGTWVAGSNHPSKKT
jgi:predicted amidohydrolase YtcJ